MHFKLASDRRAAAIERLENRCLLSIQPIGQQFLVNTNTTSGGLYGVVAMNSTGDFLVVWNSYNQDGSSWGVYAQRYDAAGIPQGSEFPVNTYTTGAQFAPYVAMDADGDFVVTWTSDDGWGIGVYARRYNSSGIAQGSEFRVNSYTPVTQGPATVAMDEDGDIVIAWPSWLQDDSGYAIYARRYNSAGVPQGDEFRVNTYTTDNQQSPRVALDGDGDFIVAWSSDNQDGASQGVYAQRYDSTGVAQGGEFRVNTYTISRQFAPCVGIDPDGESVVAWSSRGQDGSGYGVYAQRYGESGAPQGEEFRVNTHTTGDQLATSVAVDTQGNFVVVWHSFAQDGSGQGVYAQRYDSRGEPHGPEFRVNTYTLNSQRNGTVAMDAEGDFVVAWQGYGPDGSGYDMYAQQYSVFPTINTASFLFATAPHRLQFTFDENVSASLGTDDVVLQNLTTGQTIPSTDLAVAYEIATNTATFNYTGNAGGIAGVLPDGNYRATRLAAGVTTPNGNPLPADHVLNFFFLQGDANHNGIVNLADFNILASNFGQMPRDFTQGDFNLRRLGDVAGLQYPRGTVRSRIGSGVDGFRAE